jgi:hypothetical protein
MDAATRAAVVEMIANGASNCAIRDALGVTVNQAAGLRRRNFGSKITASEARPLPKRSAAWKIAAANEATVLIAIEGAEAVTVKGVTQRLAGAISANTIGKILKRLATVGQLKQHSAGKGLRYRRVAEVAHAGA